MELTVLILLKFLKRILSRAPVFTDLRWPSCKSVITKYSGATCRFRLNHCQTPCVYLCASLCVHLHLYLYHCVCLCAQSLSSVQLVVTPWGVACKAFQCPWNFLGQNTGVGCHFLLQGILLIQRPNPCFLHLRQWKVDVVPLCRLEIPSLPLE